jgi:Flp pilus assembly protein TadD
MRVSDPEPLLVLAELLLHRGNQPGRARELLEGAADRFPGDHRLQALLGGLFLALGQQDLAERHYRLALELSPDDPALMSNLALVLSHMGRLAEAEPLARRAVELSPHDPVSRQVLEHLSSRQ